MKMCRMGGEVECKEVSVAWIRDNNNKHVMAVRTEEGWREIMVSLHYWMLVLAMIIILLF